MVDAPPLPVDHSEFEPAPAQDRSVDFREPTFTLRAQDVLAPAIVKAWCEMAALASVNPDKIREARQIALAMESWRKRKVPD